MSNPFQSLKDMYDAQNAEIDKHGTSKLYKKASEIIFEDMKKNGYTITGIKYLSGYFIFASGSCSVVHYYVKELPGWKFGIWFSPNPNLTEETTHSVLATWFTQYEENIDKFKPSASSIVEYDMEADLSSNPQHISGLWKVYEHMEFIHKHPELAWYRDLHMVDFNTEYISEEFAKDAFANRNDGELYPKEICDRPEIKTRCKNCKFLVEGGICDLHSYQTIRPDDEDFCSRGEPKEEV